MKCSLPAPKQFKEAVRRIERQIGRRLSKDDKRELHEEITGMHYDIEEIVKEGLKLFEGRKGSWKD